MSIQPGDARHDFRKTDSLIVSIPPCEMMFSHFHDFTFSLHQSPEAMLSPLISPPTPSEIHELVIVHSREEAQLLEPHLKTMERSDRVVRWGIKEQI